MSPRCAVITPSYEQGAYIERTIASVLSQDVPLEYAVMDGGSRDTTVEVLKRYAGRLSYVSEPDRGQAHAVNKGLAATTGDIICWINSDDVYYPGALRAVVDYFDAHPQVDVVYGRAHHIDAEDRVLEEYPTEPFDYPRLTERCFICQPACFFRRSVVDRLGGLDESLHYVMDYELWLRWARRGARFAQMPDVLAGSRLHEATKTLAGRSKVHAEMLRMMRRTLGRVPDRWLFNHVHADMGLDGRRTPSAAETALLAWRSLALAWRWNGRVSVGMVRQSWQWLRPHLRLAPARSSAEVEGVYGDGWTSDEVRVALPRGAGEVEIEASLPGFVPEGEVALEVLGRTALAKQRVALSRGGSVVLRQAAGAGERSLRVRVSPTFKPCEAGLGGDARELGCKVGAIRWMAPTAAAAVLREV